MNPLYVASRALVGSTLKATPLYRRGNARPIGVMGDFVREQPRGTSTECEHAESGHDASRCYVCLYKKRRLEAEAESASHPDRWIGGVWGRYDRDKKG